MHLHETKGILWIQISQAREFLQSESQQCNFCTRWARQDLECGMERKEVETIAPRGCAAANRWRKQAANDNGLHLSNWRALCLGVRNERTASPGQVDCPRWQRIRWSHSRSLIYQLFYSTLYNKCSTTRTSLNSPVGSMLGFGQMWIWFNSLYSIIIFVLIIIPKYLLLGGMYHWIHVNSCKLKGL